MIWFVLVVETQEKFRSKTFPELTDDGYKIILLDDTVKYFQGHFLALPETGVDS